MTVEAISEALVSLARGDTGHALARLQSIEDSPLASALVDGLAGDRADGVYVDPSAFTRFIDSAPNDHLYRDVHAALGRWVANTPSVDSAVDIGCGDGRVTAAVAPPDAEVELVEPSNALLGQAVDRLQPRPVRAFEGGVAEWLDDGDDRQLDLGWSTFALHNLSPEERSVALRGIASRVERFAVVEFDVPVWRSVEQWAAHCADRYVAGAAAHPDPLVLSGFLVPVLLGQFVPGAERHTYEQPLSAWHTDLAAAGFDDIAVEIVHSDFWWGRAGLVTGHRAI